MLNRAKNPMLTSSADDHRQTFESAIAHIQRCGKSPGPPQSPIAVRSQTTIPGDQATEKRALTEAARALARLWNVSPTMAR